MKRSRTCLKRAVVLSGKQDRLNRIFLVLVGIFSAIYGVAFVLQAVFHLLQISVMVALMGVWVIIGFSWMTLDGLIERKTQRRIPVPRI